MVVTSHPFLLWYFNEESTHFVVFFTALFSSMSLRTGVTQTNNNNDNKYKDNKRLERNVTNHDNNDERRMKKG